MRRVTGFVLVLLGAFLIVVTALLRFWLAPEAVAVDKFPLGKYQQVTLSGSGSYFSGALKSEQTGVSVGVTYTFLGDPSLGNSSTAVWNFFTSVQDLTDKQPISYVSYREAYDRTTGDLVNCCGVFVTNPVSAKKDTSVHMSGLGEYFPTGTKAQTYTIFDTTAARPEQARYDGTALVEGISTDKFVEKVTPVRIGSDAVPGSVIGDPFKSSVTLGEYYSGTNTYYVDPETGAPLDVVQDQTITLGSSPSNTQILASNISVIETSKSIASVVSEDRSARHELLLVEDILPLTGLIAGVVLLVLGIVLLRLSNARAEPDPRYMHELDTYA